jgi:hypothetical protein
MGLPAFARPIIRIGATFDNGSVEKASGTGLFLGSSAYFQCAQPCGQDQWHRSSSC